jgi:hypothetical protein
MGKFQRQRFFNNRQASLRSRQEEDHRQIIDDLEVEVHQLRNQLNTALGQVGRSIDVINRLNTRLNNLSSRSSNDRYRIRY